MSIEARLKTSLVVAAEIKRCECLSIPTIVNHRGDNDRGLLLIKQYVYDKGCKIYTQTRDLDDNLRWHQPMGIQWIDERQADQYINKQIEFDDDLWVLEIEDSKNLYQPLDEVATESFDELGRRHI